MKKYTVERNFLLLAGLGFLLFSIGAILTTIVPPLVDTDMWKVRDGLHRYTEQEKRGRDVYIAEGCVYCHTQQIRHLKSDQVRFGWRLVDAAVSEAWEYTLDKPHLIGTKRTGPDLARLGGKYSSEWHWAHFKNPRDMGERFYDTKGKNSRIGSVMPSFRHLSDDQIIDLVAYLQTLGKNKNWRKDKDGNLLDDYEQ